MRKKEKSMGKGAIAVANLQEKASVSQDQMSELPGARVLRVASILEMIACAASILLFVVIWFQPSIAKYLLWPKSAREFLAFESKVKNLYLVLLCLMEGFILIACILECLWARTKNMVLDSLGAVIMLAMLMAVYAVRFGGNLVLTILQCVIAAAMFCAVIKNFRVWAKDKFGTVL